MTDTNQLIKAFVKTLEGAGIITTNPSDLTSTQFECFTLQCRRYAGSTLSRALSLLSMAGKQCVSLVMVTAMRRCGSDSTVARTLMRSSRSGRHRACRPLRDCLTMNTIELAAEFIQRAAFVDAIWSPCTRCCAGERYMKMVDEEYSYVWLQPFDPLFSSCLSDAQMSQTVREDWLVLV